MHSSISTRLPDWAQEWLGSIMLLGPILLIVFVAWLLQRTIRSVILTAAELYDLPRHLIRPAVLLMRWAIYLSAPPLILGRLGGSGTVLWTAFTGLAAGAAAALSASWRGL